MGDGATGVRVSHTSVRVVLAPFFIGVRVAERALYCIVKSEGERLASGSSVFEVNIRTGTLTDVREKVLDLSFRPDMSHAHVAMSA